MSFRGLMADHTPLDEFRAKVPEAKRVKSSGPDNYLPLHAFEWSDIHPNGVEIHDMNSVEKLLKQSQGSVRIVFAPRDEPHPTTVKGFVELFERCEIPSAFVNEGLQGVSQSFGVYNDTDGTTCVWFHILCKDIRVDQNQIVHPQDNADNQDATRIAAQRQSHANFTWLKPGFVLKIRDSGVPKPHSASPSTSDTTLATPYTQAQVELFCFGSPITLRDRFRKLIDVATGKELIQDPYILLDIVFEEMYKLLDRSCWVVGNIFGHIETQTLAMASKPGKATKDLPHDHFTGLHNLAKHTIFLRENCEAALATLDGLQDSHKVRNGSGPSHSQELTRQALQYRGTLLQSTQRRLASLDERMANIIQLSFHIVTQGDSRVMQSENQSMKTIAVMTLIFMPLSTIAGIFGTQFMKLQDEKPYHMTVSRDFWLLWVIAIPLMAIVWVIWRACYMDARGRLVDDLPQQTKGEFVYTIWNSLRERKRSLPEKA
ncbi:hypothetical protein J1614_000434 [Plenodomus biglobosus]|nr:hypothetical protein J1614_000434 [Plenodomus biglobosus]